MYTDEVIMTEKRVDKKINVDFVQGEPRDPINDDSFSFTCFGKGSDGRRRFDEFEVDVSLQFQCRDRTTGIKSKSSSQDFDFNMPLLPLGPVDTGDISPADELFYKGQLLPLHLPPHLRMVEHLSSPYTRQNNENEANSSSFTVSCYLQPEYLKTCLSAIADKQEIDSIHDVSNFGSLEAHDLWNDNLTADVYNDSESSGPRERGESNGSLPDHFLADHGKGIEDSHLFPNCYKDPTSLYENRIDGTQGLQDPLQDTRGASCWSRKWKVFLPELRKSVKVTGQRAQRWSSSILKSYKYLMAGAQVAKKGFAKDPPENHQEQILSCNFYSVEHKDRPCESAETDKERLHMKARNYWQRYVKMSRVVTLNHAKDMTAQAQPVVTAKTCQESEDERIYHSIKAESIAARDSCGSSSIACTNTSPSTQDGVNLITQSCPSISPSTVMELQSAIQGAIAHCKQSQRAAISSMIYEARS